MTARSRGVLPGKTNREKLLFGYARLPWLDYVEPALSASPPNLTKKEEGLVMAVEVQNFGQVVSLPAPLKIVHHIEGREVEIGSSKVPALAPFEKTVVEIPCANRFEPGVSYETSVMIRPNGQNPKTLWRSPSAPD